MFLFRARLFTLIILSALVSWSSSLMVPVEPAVARQRKVCVHGTHEFARAEMKGIGKVLSATLDVPIWCHRGRRVVGPIRWGYDHKIYKSTFFGLFFAWNGWDSQRRYPYSYRRRGVGSGYAIKAKAHFKGCLDPFHGACPYDHYFAMRVYLHYDGSCSAYATYHKDTPPPSDKNALRDTTC